MSQTNGFGLPCILANQAKKSVTFNQALRWLDVLVQVAETFRCLTVPPVASEEGGCWILAAGASRIWAEHGERLPAGKMLR